MGHQPQIGPATALTAAPSPRALLWWRVTRPKVLVSSLIPGLSGGLVALGHRDAHWWLLAVALLALALLHAGTNAANDVEDYANGVDPPDKARNSQALADGRLTVTEGRWLYGLLFSGALVLGIVICLIQGPVLLAIGLAGILGGLLYTSGPQPYKYIGLGDPLIVLLMGPLLTQGVYTAVTGDGFDASAFWLGVAPGLLIECVLAGNNLADLETDRAAGLRTLAVRIGFLRARRLYLATLASAWPAVIVLWLTGLFDAWILLPLVLTPRFVALARAALTTTGADNPEVESLHGWAAQLHLMFCMLLCAGVVMGHL